eukprot:SM000142S00548  [mRNA]  locus=s142:277986:283058:- [translate_table: standard]
MPPHMPLTLPMQMQIVSAGLPVQAMPVQMALSMPTPAPSVVKDMRTLLQTCEPGGDGGSSDMDADWQMQSAARRQQQLEAHRLLSSAAAAVAATAAAGGGQEQEEHHGWRAVEEEEEEEEDDEHDDRGGGDGSGSGGLSGAPDRRTAEETAAVGGDEPHMHRMVEAWAAGGAAAAGFWYGKQSHGHAGGGCDLGEDGAKGDHDFEDEVECGSHRGRAEENAGGDDNGEGAAEHEAETRDVRTWASRLTSTAAAAEAAGGGVAYWGLPQDRWCLAGPPPPPPPQLQWDLEQELRHQDNAAAEPAAPPPSRPPAAHGRKPELADDSVTLRQWLSRPERDVDHAECLHILRQVADVLAAAHRDGVPLPGLRPSRIVLAPLTNRVTVLDALPSAPPPGPLPQQPPWDHQIPASGGWRGHRLEQGHARASAAEQPPKAASSSAPARRPTIGAVPDAARLVGDVRGSGRGSGSGDVDSGMMPWWKPAVARAASVMAGIGDGSTLASAMHQHQAAPRLACVGGGDAWLEGIEEAELAWYSSPEETEALAAGRASSGTPLPVSLAANVYSLGVLFFELFCRFRSPAERTVVMADLRHRILPPRLLLECPKEAAFCLWLLHPQPTSRPKMQEVLESDLLGEAEEALAERQAVAEVEEQESEASVLLDFLQHMHASKAAAAQRLAADVERLTFDIGEVVRRQALLRACTGAAGAASRDRLRPEAGHSSEDENCAEGNDLASPAAATISAAAAAAPVAAALPAEQRTIKEGVRHAAIDRRPGNPLGKRARPEAGVDNAASSDGDSDGHHDQERSSAQRRRLGDGSLSSRSARVMSNFENLERIYFAMRWKLGPAESAEAAAMGAAVGAAAPAGATAGQPLLLKPALGSDGPGSHSSLVSQLQPPAADLAPPGSAAAAGARGVGLAPHASSSDKDWLGCFFDSLCKFARYSRFEVRATLRHGDLLNTANMVCSLAFDRDEEFFATAGVCKRIKIFEADAVLGEAVDIHYPVVEMASRSKLSSVCWNSYIKSHIASSDYEGVVQLWDASTSQPVIEYEEHEKRAWSVDFSRADPTRLASGSDDGSVKLWSISQEASVATIRTKANVCCVQFPMESSHLLAFGSADYKVYCYDLRNAKVPLAVLSGHQKAVSYVKFVDAGTLVSASTDNTLKLWDLTQVTHQQHSGLSTSPSLTYTGHTNEKNFVGLSVADGYIACGSETNAVFAYHKSLPMPMASHKFGGADPVTGTETEDDSGQFVSSVCWRGKTQTLVAANSMGNIKVLEMV